MASSQRSLAEPHGEQRIFGPETTHLAHSAVPSRDSDTSTDIILLGQTKESPDLGSPLWPQSVGKVDISQPRQVALALLDDHQGQDSEVQADDAPPDGLPLPLTGTPWSVARVPLRQQKPNTSRVHDTLLHRETLLVVSSSDPEDVSLELITNGITCNLLTHALVDENTETTLVIDFDELLGSVGGVSVIVGESDVNY